VRKTIIFGTLAALFGFAALAQASDRSPAKTGEGTQVTRVAANDSESRRERDKKAERSRERHDGSGDERHEVREHHDENEAAVHQDRR
jgi:hypothetical protein